MLIVLSSVAALACAGLVHAEGLHAESAAQEAILDVHGDAVTATYRVTWEGDAPDFGWLIPVPGTFVDLVDGDTARFDTLREQTGPLVWWEEPYEDERSCGCAGALKGDGGGERANTADVVVVASGFTGTYEFVVLSADDPTGITDWLDDNGWQAGGELDVLDAYATEGVLTLAALRLDPGQVQTGLRELPPVALSYDGGGPWFPSRMGAFAAAPALRTTVWVVADEAYTTTGWQASPLEFIGGGTDDDPVALFDDALADLSDTNATWGVTFVDELDGRTVTRFDALAPRDLHTADTAFVPSGEDRTWRLEIELVPGRNAALWLIPLALVPVLRRRRRGARQS